MQMSSSSSSSSFFGTSLSGFPCCFAAEDNVAATTVVLPQSATPLLKSPSTSSTLSTESASLASPEFWVSPSRRQQHHKLVTPSPTTTPATTLNESSASSSSQLRSALVSPYNQHRRKRRRRHVRFLERVNVYHANPLTRDQYKTMWFSPHDIKRKKSQVAAFANEVLKVEETLAADVRHACRGSSNNNNKVPAAADSYIESLRILYEYCTKANAFHPCSIPEDTHARFERWIRVTPGRVGLEKTIIPSIAQDRVQRKLLIWNAIQELQNDGVWRPDEVLALKIRAASETLSRPSVAFAYLVACAHQGGQ